MIIGNGLVAKGFFPFNDQFDDCTVFAAGVSNSKEKEHSPNFLREKRTLLSALEKNKGLKFLYFSTVLVGFKNNAYYAHKREMESLVMDHAPSSIIFRVPQIVGNTDNKNTLINNLSESIRNGKKLNVSLGVKRSIMDIDDVVEIVKYCKDNMDKGVVLISGIEPLKVLTLCCKIGKVLNKPIKIVFNRRTEDNGWVHENSEITLKAIKHLGIRKKGYSTNVIKKYIKP
tara:strand:- start:7976 stop:8662 length:687 start_codon:yes stop_codon:yes gene_type:complete